MLVEAKCIARAWDSGAAMLFYPGEVYKIEHDGPLATLKVGSSYVFEFDRAAPGSRNDYQCKECGKKCKSLNELGTHTNSEHKQQPFVDGTEDEPVVKKPDGRKRPRTFTCKECGEVSANLYAVRKHKKVCKGKPAETESVPA